jgi:pilus assembly protein Flp/PilA
MKQISSVVARFLRAEHGGTAIEYSLLAALVAVALLGSIVLLGESLANIFDSAASKLNKAW